MKEEIIQVLNGGIDNRRGRIRHIIKNIQHELEFALESIESCRGTDHYPCNISNLCEEWLKEEGELIGLRISRNLIDKSK